MIQQHDFPTSKHIARIHYNPDNARLKVEFRNGRTYEYEDVLYETYNQFVSSESAGKFFNAEIKGKYRVV